MIMNWQQNQTPPPLLDEVVHIWCASLRVSSQRLNDLWYLLLDDEKKKANKFISVQAKEGFIISRGILRLLLSKYLGIAPEKLVLKQGEYGKPYVQPDTEQLSLEFNISHSKDLVLLAFTLRNQIGIDIEYIQKDFSYEEIAPHFFSKQENITLSVLPKEQQREAFFTCWTRKEAFIKAIGEGLSFPLDKFDVDLTTNEENRPLPVYIHNERVTNKVYSLYALYPARDYVAALALDALSHKICKWFLI
jgi:4'-phosphopantetheinyl transferase